MEVRSDKVRGDFLLVEQKKLVAGGSAKGRRYRLAIERLEAGKISKHRVELLAHKGKVSTPNLMEQPRQCACQVTKKWTKRIIINQIVII